MDANKLIELSQDFICTADFKGRFASVNPACLELIGYTQDELVCMEFFDLVHPEDMEKLKLKFASLLDENKTVNFENRLFHKDGTIKYISWKASPEKNNKLIYAIGRDITEKQNSEVALRNSEELFRTTLSSISDPVFILDDKGKFFYICPNVSDTLGFSIEEIEKMGNISELFGDPIFNPQELILQGKTTNLEYSLQDKWGKQHDFLINIKQVSIGWGTILMTLREITTRKQAEKELTNTKLFYENIIEGVQDGIWVADENDIIFFANAAMEEIAGIPREKIQGNNILKDFLEETTGELLSYYKQAKKSKKPIWYEVKVKTSVGKDTFQNGWLIPRIKDEKYKGIICTIRDVTEQKKAEIELLAAKENAEESKTKLLAALESMSEAIFISDINGNLVNANEAYIHICGFKSREEYIKKFEDYPLLFDVYLASGELAPIENWAVPRALKGEIVENEIYKIHRKDTNDTWIGSYNFAPIKNRDNEIVGCVVTIRDVTEDIRKEEDLIKAKQKAEDADRLKTAFLTNMSHEIRTPLNAVLGFSELLTKKKVSEKEKKTFSEYIRLNGLGLAKIIDDIIDVSKLESNRLSIKKTSFNLHTLFEELNNYYESVLVQKSKTNIALELKMPEPANEEFFIETDEQRLKQILNNLLSNAVKYSEEGKITFGYKLKTNKLHFFVKDTGYGISPENISKIFERFIQLSPKYISLQEGTGLGLAICKNLVTLLGGDLKVKSELNKGSEFYFTIPFVKSEKPALEKAMPAIAMKKDLSQLKILIADDEDSNFVLTKRILKPSKIESDWAKNGKEAVEMAKNKSYDLIIMDIKMPEMDGIEATRLIKKQNKDLPIIIQTAFAMKEVKDEAQEAGCNDFIVKPIALDAFLELVNKHIK